LLGESTTPYQVTGGVLAAGVPSHVTAVTAVATYPSKEAFEENIGLHPTDPATSQLYPGHVVCAALGREFLVPDPDEHRSDDDMLRAAVDFAGDPDFRRKRRNFWRWEREFLNDGVTDQRAMAAAVEEMRELIEEEKATVRKRQWRTISKYAFAAATITLGLVGGPLSPVAVGGAFLSVARFTSDQLLDGKASPSRSPAALFYDARRHLGWDQRHVRQYTPPSSRDRSRLRSAGGRLRSKPAALRSERHNVNEPPRRPGHPVITRRPRALIHHTECCQVAIAERFSRDHQLPKAALRASGECDSRRAPAEDALRVHYSCHTPAIMCGARVFAREHA
jgi:hypothetical protein